MHSDDRTLVALCADLRACGAAMPAAVSVVATWAAEHSLSISADRSGAALFCIASHRQSDEDTADHRLGGGKPCVKSHPVRLLGNAIDRQLNFVSHVTAAVGQTVPRRRQLRLGAGAGASQHTMRSFLVGCVHGALHHGGETLAPCRPPLASTAWKCGTATAAHHRSSHAYHRRIPLSTWPPVQHRCGGSLGSAHPHGTNVSHFSVILRTCVAQYARKPHLRQYLGRQRRPFRCREMPSSRSRDASAAAWGSPRTASAPLLLSTEFSPGTL
ncbi:hypothetical protein TcYC6_0057560 [Trypanosoma cruzi]|nr:hypothetical protein TcYC6_0057560 [Trypanosoma cruzi]